MGSGQQSRRPCKVAANVPWAAERLGGSEATEAAGKQVTRNRGLGAGRVPGGAPGSGSGSRQRQPEVETEGGIVPRLLPWPLVLLAGSGGPQGRPALGWPR